MLGPDVSDRRSNFTTMRPSAAAKMKKGPNLSIQDVLGHGASFGMSYYKTPSNEMLLKRVYNGK